MKKSKKVLWFTIGFMGATLIALGGFLIYLYKKVGNLNQEVSDLNFKADQSDLAARTAMKQSADIINAMQSNGWQEEQDEAWENRKLIGFRTANG